MTVDGWLLGFLGVALLVVVSPGPDMALVARNALLAGRRAGLATVVGVCCGIAAWALAAAIGLAALLATSSAAFTALRLAGAVYLVVLGVRTFRSGGDPLPATGPRDASLTARRAWTLGWLSASLNPKLGVFFLTLLPQFAGPGHGETDRLLALAILFCLLGAAWLSLVVELAVRARVTVSRPAVGRAIRRLTGTVLIGLGIRVGIAAE